jgi:hypothetical protein
MTVEQTHEEKETLAVDVLLPGHEPRKETALFERSLKLLIEREGVFAGTVLLAVAVDACEDALTTL